MSGARREIERLLVDYATAVDTQAWALLDQVFVPDSELDFTAVGGRKGTYAEIRPWLEKRMARFEALHHQLGNVRIDIDHHEARCECYVRATHAHRVDGALVYFELGGVYTDEAALTDEGWRLTKRTLHHRFTLGTLPTR